MNKVILKGNLVRDVETRSLPNGGSVSSFSIACNREYMDSNKNKQKEVSYVDVESFGKQGEVVAKFLKKGKPVLIEGRLKQDRWEDKDGNKRSKIKVVMEGFDFIDGGGGGQNDNSNNNQGNDEDIPF